MLQAELEREHAEAADRHVVRLERPHRLRRPRRWLRAVRGAAAT
jgi:hypothetical protein